jgi:protease PrsW
MIQLLSILPALVVCYVIFRVDHYERESWWSLALCFAGGALITWPAVWSELWITVLLGVEHMEHLDEILILSFGVVAPIEEALKWVLLLLIFPRRFFNEPLDGIVYAVMIGMGFAAIENIAYSERFGPGSLWLRMLTAIPAHLVFAIVQGYYAGLAKFKAPTPQAANRWMLKGFLYSYLLHGIYDLCVFQDWWSWLFMLATTALYLCLYYCSQLIREHLEHSPFKPK